MKVNYRICDFCKEPLDNVEDFQYKYKTKRFVWGKWRKADICHKCMKALIEAKENGLEKNN